MKTAAEQIREVCEDVNVGESVGSILERFNALADHLESEQSGGLRERVCSILDDMVMDRELERKGGPDVPTYGEYAKRILALVASSGTGMCPYYCEPSHVVGEKCTCPCHSSAPRDESKEGRR